MKKIRHYTSIVLLCMVSLALCLPAGCTPASDSYTLKLALLPVLDSFPVYVAEAGGYFKELGLNVEIIPIASAPERDQLIQTGQADGMMNELVATLLMNKNRSNVLIVRYARTATAQVPVFRILGAPNSKIKTVQDLRGVPIAISQGTVIEYTTERLLEKAGFKPSEIKTINVPKIPDRITLLENGDALAANVPDPVATLSLNKGATLLIDDTAYPEISFSVYTFRTEVVRKHPELVRKFNQAIEKAVKDLNTDKNKWKPLLSQQNLVPAPMLDKYVLPDYPAAGVPTETQFIDGLTWVKQKGLVSNDIAYKDTIDGSFLPK